jgi:hypothetical protein
MMSITLNGSRRFEDVTKLEIRGDKVNTFIRDNYGKTTLSGYMHLIDDDAGVIIYSHQVHP